MLKFKKTLSATSRAIRHRRNVLNILITMFAWSVEFVGNWTIFLGTFILGHGNSVITLTLQTLTLIFSFNILPCTFLINEDGWKADMLERTWYTQLVKMFDSCLSIRCTRCGCRQDNRVGDGVPQIEAPANDNQEQDV